MFWKIFRHRKVYLAGIGETDNFCLRAPRLQQEGGEVRRVQRNATEPSTLPAAWVTISLVSLLFELVWRG